MIKGDVLFEFPVSVTAEILSAIMRGAVSYAERGGRRKSVSDMWIVVGCIAL